MRYAITIICELKMDLAKAAQEFVVENYSGQGIECSDIGDGFVFLQLPPRIQNIEEITQCLQNRFGASIDAELDEKLGVSLPALKTQIQFVLMHLFFL